MIGVWEKPNQLESLNVFYFFYFNVIFRVSFLRLSISIYLHIVRFVSMECIYCDDDDDFVYFICIFTWNESYKRCSHSQSPPFHRSVAHLTRIHVFLFSRSVNIIMHDAWGLRSHFYRCLNLKKFHWNCLFWDSTKKFRVFFFGFICRASWNW